MSEDKMYKFALMLGWTFALATIIFVFLDSSREHILVFIIFLLTYFLMGYGIGLTSPINRKTGRSDVITGFFLIVSMLAYYVAGYLLLLEYLKNNPIGLLIYGVPFIALEMFALFFRKRSKEQEVILQ